MKFLLYNKKNQLDEMQEQTMLHIEARGFWLVWTGLLVVMAIQMVLGAPAKQMTGEWVVFMASCLYTVVECIRNGLWDRHLSRSVSTNALLSLLAGAVLTILVGLTTGYWWFALIPGVITAVLCFVVLQVCMHVTEKRRKELDNPDDKEDE